MARQTYYVTRDMRHPLYKSRMLEAGPIELDASAARLFRQLGVPLTDERPRRAATAAAETETPAPAKPKAAPRKRKAKTKK